MKKLVVLVALVALGVLILLRRAQDAPPKLAQPDQGATARSGQPPVQASLESGQRETVVPSHSKSDSFLSEGSLELRTLDSSSTPISGVQIALLGPEGCIPLGVTDSAGKLWISGSSVHCPYSLEARLEGFCVEERTIGCRDTSVVLIMRPGRSIRGRVLSHDQRPVGEGVTVVAQKADQSLPSAAYFSSCASNHPPALAVRTNRAGEFRISGLNDTSAYRLVAGGNSAISGQVFVQPTEDYVELIATPVFGAVVHFASRQGQALSIPLANRAFESVETADSTLYFVEAERFPHAPLLGLRASDCPSQSTKLLLFVPRLHDSSNVTLSGVQFKAKYIGFGEAEVFFSAAKFPLETEPTTLCLEEDRDVGAVTVIFKPEYLSGLELQLPPYPSPLLKLGTSSGSIDLKLDQFVRGTQSIRGIPTGEYAARLKFAHSFRSVDCGTISVKKGETTSITPLNGMEPGALLISLERQDGTEYEGQLALDIARVDPKVGFSGAGEMEDMSTFYFERSPYLVVGLDSSTYRFRITTPINVHPDFRPVEFDAVSGEISGVRLRISR